MNKKEFVTNWIQKISKVMQEKERKDKVQQLFKQHFGIEPETVRVEKDIARARLEVTDRDKELGELILKTAKKFLEYDDITDIAVLSFEVRETPNYSETKDFQWEIGSTYIEYSGVIEVEKAKYMVKMELLSTKTSNYYYYDC